MPPRWSFGFWQSKYGYRSWDEVWEVVRKAREERVPMDVVHLDPYWLRDRMYADLVWDEERFPDPAGNLARLREEGIRICLWLQPWIPEESEVFAEGAGARRVRDPRGRLGLLLHADHPRPSAEPLRHRRLQQPDRPRVVRPEDPGPDRAGRQRVQGRFRRGDPRGRRLRERHARPEMHNLYPLLYNAAFYEAFERSGRAERSGLLGSVRLGRHPAVPGLLERGHALQLPLNGLHVLERALDQPAPGWRSGATTSAASWARPTPSSSSAGRSGACSARTAGRTAPRAASRGRRVQQALTIFREYDELRYQLIPYLYSLAHEAHQTGLPVLRPMVLEYQDDPATHALDRQYLLGPSILVVPVLEAGAQSVRVYLPRGTWYNYWTDTAYEGGRWLAVPTQLDCLPLFVKAGSILPLGPIQQHTGEQAAEHGGPDELTLRVYPLTLPDPARASTVLYEDGGATAFAYDDGTMTVVPSDGAPQARTYTVEVVGRDPKTGYRAHRGQRDY